LRASSPKLERPEEGKKRSVDIGLDPTFGADGMTDTKGLASRLRRDGFQANVGMSDRIRNKESFFENPKILAYTGLLNGQELERSVA
jgi:hypothetical protein